MSLAEVSEYGTVTIPFELTEADHRMLLNPKLRKHIKLVPGPGSSWQVKAGDVVGVLQLTNGPIQIRPKIKISGAMLLNWLHYALDPQKPFDPPDKNWDVGGTHFSDMVVRALLNECVALSRGELRRDYQSHDSVEGVLRGRLDLVRQATRRYGMVDRLHVRTFERTADIWENQVCGAALRHVATTADNMHHRAEALRLLVRFPECSGKAALKILARARHNRLNHRYRAAHTWAAVILRAGGVRDLYLDGDLVGASQLLDMPVLWERVVQRMVDTTTITPIEVGRPGRPPARYTPDAVVVTPTGRLAIDAKYKNYDTRNVTRDDIHQLLTYASAYRMSDTDRLHTAIVYPSTSAAEPRLIKVDFGGNRLAEIDLVGVDVTVRPEVNATVLRERFHS
ncbi:McrC family protein [Lentzea sp. JNUCC 0626]|uniref:McrC family protein n=1 Tax=Lentzea sp. JNUCC 0626 TaxID=3367513 RepID=UPI003748DE50